MRYVLFFAVLVGVGFQTLPAHVEAFDITPGKWRFEYESRASFQPQPQTRTDTQCVTEPNWDPTASITKSGDCRLSNIAQDTTSFSGTLTCSRGQGNPPMTGSISYTSTRHQPDRSHRLQRGRLRDGNEDQRHPNRRVRLNA